MSRTMLGTLFLIAVVAAPMSAHETGAIHLKSRNIPAGGELAVRGEKLPKSSKIQLRLVGALATHPLGDVRTTAAGTFDALLTLPAAASPGSYAVVVIAADGDVVARTDLLVTAAADTHDMAIHPDADTAAMSAPHATAEMMKLDSTMSGREWGVIGTIVGASIVGGLVLLVGARRNA